jgi:hypothetical protein
MLPQLGGENHFVLRTGNTGTGITFKNKKGKPKTFGRAHLRVCSANPSPGGSDKPPMAIYSLHHSWIGRSTHAARTAGAHIRYITRVEAATCITARHMPADRHKARAWLDKQENEDRKNARVIDKVMVALPIELSHRQRVQLVEAFAETMTCGRAPWFAAIHDAGKDASNPHAHLVLRDRDVATGRRVMELSEMDGTDRLRSAWERAANQALARAGFEARIDRRPLAAQGVDRKPEIHVGPNARVLAARGVRPVSAPLEVVRHRHGRHQLVVIDYPAIDRGHTRAEFNAEIQMGNAARELSRAARDLSPARAGMSGPTFSQPITNIAPTGQGEASHGSARLYIAAPCARSKRVPPKLSPEASRYAADRAAIVQLYAAKVVAARLAARPDDLAAMMAAIRAEEGAALKALKDRAVFDSGQRRSVHRKLLQEAWAACAAEMRAAPPQRSAPHCKPGVRAAQHANM